MLHTPQEPNGPLRSLGCPTGLFDGPLPTFFVEDLVAITTVGHLSGLFLPA